MVGIGDSGVVQVSRVEEGYDPEAVGGSVLEVRGPADRGGLFLQGDVGSHESVGQAEG